VIRSPIGIAGAGLLLIVMTGCGAPADRDGTSSPPGEETARGAPGDLPPEGYVETPDVKPEVDYPGRWRRFRTHRFDPQLSEEQRRRIEQLESIGYASGSRKRSAPDVVVRHDRESVFAGLNFYVSGHAPEATLIDMEGRVLHRWARGFRDVWPDYPVSDEHRGTAHWRRAYLYENGDILAIYEGLGMVKLDRDSNVLWAAPLRTHHDLQVMPEGDIYTLAYEAHVVPRVHSERPILDDFFLVLGPDGGVKKRVSILEAFENSDYSRLVQSLFGRSGDIFHTNTVDVLDGRIADEMPSFARGNVLIYILKMQILAVLDLEQERIVWARHDPVWQSHDPKILPNGNLLIFDNIANKKKASRVVEYQAVSREPAWIYEGSEQESFFSMFCGTAERLPNGNTLIVESDNGRAFEVTSAGAIVWEFHNPHRAGEEGEYIATLFDMVRLPPEFPTAWIEPGAGD
jgi:hypothetical protein